MATTLKVHVNVGAEDTARDELGADYVEINPASDEIIFSNGSDVVKDGEPIPNETQLNQAGVLISETEPVIVPKYFLKDVSAALLKEIKLAGNQRKQHVFCCEFDGETASEPVLELWDNGNYDSIELNCLGAETPSDSWFWGVVTTNGVPGAGWLGTSPSVGNRLAGATEGYFLKLNGGGGPLNEAKDLYFQLKTIIPTNFPSALAENPLWVVKWAGN